MISNSGLVVSRAHRNESGDVAEQCSHGGSGGTPSVMHVVKAVGVLALILSGGGQAAALPRNRHLLNVGAEYVEPRPYDYDTICKAGILDSYAEGLNYEDCMAQEQATIDEIKQTKPLDTLKECYTVSGYLSLASLGTSALLAMTRSSAAAGVAALGTLVGLTTLIPTAVCGLVHSKIQGRLSDSRDEAEECCKFFPEKADIKPIASPPNTPAVNATAPGEIRLAPPPLAPAPQ